MEGPLPSPPPRAVAAIPYASPAGFAAEEHWREGKRLVVMSDRDRKAHLPPRCVKCNAPAADRKPWRKTVSWHHPGYFALLPAGVLIYAIVAASVSKKVTVHAALCATHRAARLKRILIGWGLFLASIACFVAAIYCGSTREFRHGPLSAILGIGGGVLFFGSLVWAIVATPVLAVRRIADHTAWFSGAGPEFLASLPGA